MFKHIFYKRSYTDRKKYSQDNELYGNANQNDNIPVMLL